MVRGNHKENRHHSLTLRSTSMFVVGLNSYSSLPHIYGKGTNLQPRVSRMECGSLLPEPASLLGWTTIAFCGALVLISVRKISGPYLWSRPQLALFFGIIPESPKKKPEAPPSGLKDMCHWPICVRILRGPCNGYHYARIHVYQALSSGAVRFLIPCQKFNLWVEWKPNH